MFTFQAQSLITGALTGTGASTSSSQPRIGEQVCTPCANGTIPAHDSQRSVMIQWKRTFHNQI